MYDRSNSKMKLKAPAKINLHLEVKNKRHDGFHEILSLFQMIDLYDIINIKRAKHNTCTIEGKFTFPAEKNIMYKAYEKYKKAANRSFGIDIKIKKNIPMEAGLGGGSSDAAAVLYALYKFFPENIKKERLFSLASQIGSDVPFFLGTASAIVKGKGEILHPINRNIDYECIIIKPDFKVSTADAYNWVDNDKIIFKQPVDEEYLKMTYTGTDYNKINYYNSFTPSLAKRFPEIQKIIKDLIDNKAFYANVSGSGSAIFGIFDTKYAHAAENKLKKTYKQISRRKPLDRNEHCI